MNKNYSLLVASVVLLASCGSKEFAITSGGENLSALTKITDGEGTSCISPFGGDYGKNLFYAQGEKKGAYVYYNIYKKENPLASASAQKTSGDNFNYSPTYCEATDKIAFRCKNDGMKSSDIFMMDGSQGKALRQVTESTNENENHPSFSSDGTYLVYDKQSYSYYSNSSFLAALGGTTTTIVQHSDVWIKNLKTGETTLLGNGYQPCFSPDDKQIAFVKYSGDAKSTSIYIMNTDGTNQVQVTDAKKGYAFNPRWSPDGKKIIFQASKKDKKDADIYIIDIDGENLTQLTTNKSEDITPYWTKDGYIYFASDRGGKKGNYQIWRFKYGN